MARQNEHTRAEGLISAYLDQRVTAEEKQFFERHVASCADCRAQLEATRSMIAALKAMPTVKAPRSFVLPREMAKQPRRSIFEWYPALRLATVVAAVVFMIVFAGDLLTARSAGQPVSMSIPAAAPVNQPAPMAQANQDSAATLQPAQEAPLMAAQAPAPPSEPITATAGHAESAASAAATTATPQATAIAAAPEAKRAVEATAVPGAASADQTTAPTTEQAALTTSAAPAAPALDPWRLVEIALLMLIVVLAVATFIARRKQV